MLDLKLTLAIISAKLLTKLIKLTNRGGGTAAPGLLALNLEPELIKRLVSKLPRGAVIISGTNGKTTTARILATILDQTKIKMIHNRAGSNLLRGIASAIITKSTLFGKIDAEMAIFEVDEATLPLILEQITPRVLVLTNLFRDQLDRYGEVNTISTKWKNALEKLPATTQVILNADDPAIAQLGDNLKAQVKYYGIEDISHNVGAVSRFADSKYCGYCATPLDYELVYISHLGKYSCPSCQKVRPQPEFTAVEIKFSGLKGTNLTVKLEGGRIQLNVPIPGLYNVYNILAATAVAFTLKIPLLQIKKGLVGFRAAFGRVEELKIDNHPVLMFLVKNPTGFNEVLRTLFSDQDQKQLLIAVNDLVADGRDVSWLWDVDFERMQGLVENLSVTGLRAYDIGLRLKYAGINNVQVESNFSAALTNAFIALKPGQILYILPTYTAMLELRKKLAKIAKTGHFWED